MPSAAELAHATLARGAERILQRVGDGGMLRGIAAGAELVGELQAMTSSMQRALDRLGPDEVSELEPRVRRVADLVNHLVTLSRRTDGERSSEGKVLADVTGTLAGLLRATADLHAALVRSRAR